MRDPLSRRTLLATVGGAAVPVAGCLGIDSDEENGDADEGNTSADTPGDGVNNDGDEETPDQDNDQEPDEGEEGVRPPAIEYGESIEQFGEVDLWGGIGGGSTGADTDVHLTGSQALRVEGEGPVAGAFTAYPDKLDLDGYDLSMAVRVEAPAGGRIAVELLAPYRSDHLVSIRTIPPDMTGWLRVDFGYTGKRGEPDLSAIEELRIQVEAPEGEAVRFWIDDIRKTAAADQGAALLSFYGGLRSHYEVVYPILEERGLAGAAAVVPRSVNASGRMTIGELRELRDAGWDVSPFPLQGTPLPEQGADQQREAIETAHEYLTQRGFPDGARHFFAPHHRVGPDTLDILREVHETGFLFGGCNTGLAPTAPHTVSLIEGTEIHGGVRRLANLADQYNQLVGLRFDDIGDHDGAAMSVEDFEAVLDHLQARELAVITPSDLLDDY